MARYPDDGQDFDTLLQCADQAMYRAKAAGRGGHVLFRDPPQAPAAGDAAELRLALARRELLLYYQPTIDTATGQAIGAEALLRWQHPNQGLLPPARFIRRAEEGGEIHALADHGLGPGDLERELSSHCVMSDPEFTLARAAELRQLGVGLVLEDVGSSMLSLVRLGQLHPAKVKIDTALVGRLPADAEARATVRAIVQLGRSPGVGVVAAGVETEAQRDELAQAGCRWQQGFLFAPPAPPSREPRWA